VLHSPQKFERPQFWNGVKNYGVEIIFTGLTSLLNFIKIYQMVQKLIGDIHTDMMDILLASVSFRKKRRQKIV
jgi:hypothetical protein